MSRWVYLTLLTVLALAFEGVCLVAGAEAAVSLLDPWPASPQVTNGTGTSRTATFTPSGSAADNRVIVIDVHAHTNNTTATTITVAYGNGTTWTSARAITNSANNQRRQNWIFYLTEADIAASSGNIIRVSNNNAGSGYAAFIATYSGVEQNPGTGAGATINASYATYLSNVSSGNFGTGLAVADGGYSQYFTTSSLTNEVTDNESYSSITRVTVGTAYGDVHWKGYATGATTNPTVNLGANGFASLAAFTLNPVSDTTPPTAGTIAVTPQSGSYVPSDFSISTTFTDNETAVTSCEYTTSGSTWAAGTVSGSGPYTCSASVTGASGSLSINMRATSSGGTGTATAVNRTADVTAPTTSALPGAGTYTADQNVTLTASDGSGSGVQGTVYCIDTANTCSPASSYVAPVAVTGTPGSSVTKYLRYRSTDNVDNAEAIKSTQYIIDQTCSDGTPSTISIPGGQTVSGTVDLTTLYTTGGNVGGFTYAINGGGVTNPWDSSSYGTAGPESVTLEVTGADPDCGGTSVIQSNTLTVNNGTATTAGLASVTAGNGQIRVSASYGGDSNASNTLKIEWDLNGGSWSGVAYGTNTLAHASSPYGYTIQGLSNGTAYQVRVTYIDGNGVSGTAVQTFTNLVPTNPLLHNSLNTGSGKWSASGGWGLAGTKYGEISCATCHTKNAGPNIKRVKQSLSAISGLFPIQAGGGSVTFTSAVDGSANFGDDSAAPRTSSSRVCEGCHTYDATQANGVKYHAYNQQTAGGHYDRADCMKCHQHQLGFKASCTACHGNPPTEDAQLVYRLDGANDTGSRTWGKHQKHAVDLAYSCNTCHAGWESTGEMPKAGNINLGFNALGDTTGTYDGRVGGAYTLQAGTTNSAGGALTCSSLYCHGSASPQWTDTATAPCGSCHGDATGAPREVAGDGDLSGAITGKKVGKHAAHLAESTARTGNACTLCHQGATHVNGGGAEVSFHSAAGASAGWVGGTSTCANLDCHDDAVWDTSTAGGCNFCHGYPPNSTNNKHAKGVAPVNHDSVNITPNHDGCTYCHGYKDSGSNTLSFADVTGLKGSWIPTAATHKDGRITTNGDGNANPADDAGYNVANGGCDTAACHGNDATHRVGAGNTSSAKDLIAIGPGACGTCHDTGAGGAPIVTSASSHTSVTRGAAFGDCTNCHSGHYTKAGGVQIANNATVGINYVKAGHGGIKLGGPGTHSSISGKTTEAEICWGCHDQNGNGSLNDAGDISEWGTNTDSNGAAANYNLGTLNQANWIGATWTSGIAKFSYKTGAIQSVHTANPQPLGGPSSNTGDTVGQIRCAYCHDVHDLNAAAGDTLAGMPYLRGNWMGNPYREDGAPQAGDTWTTNIFGAVPRGTTASVELGGFQIDQNNGNPTTGWTLTGSAGLCTLCHGTNVDSMNQFGSASTDWIGTNGHSNAAIGGTGSNAVNIFSTTDRNSSPPAFSSAEGNNAGNPAMAYQQISASWTQTRAYGFRSSTAEPDGWNRTPRTTNRYAHDSYNWGADTNTALQVGYHKFSCSKCHNPHASRLPRLMITNCLDTKHNTWDTATGVQLIPAAGTANSDGSATVSADNGSVPFSQATSAQNCHRLKDPAYSNAKGSGWNRVTPW